MKIVTVNVPESYIEAIKKLIGQDGLYPSRSELIRCAVREFLIKELKLAENMAKYKEVEIDIPEEFDDENFVRVPKETVNEKSEPIREFRTYKILKRLNYTSSESKPEPSDHGAFLGKANYDDIPGPSNHSNRNSRGLAQLRAENPNEPDFKFINERLI